MPAFRIFSWPSVGPERTIDLGLTRLLFGNYSKKQIKRIQPIVDRVLALEEKYAAMSDDELREQTQLLKDRLQTGETTDDIMPDAFAVCREASWRVLDMKHFQY